MTPEEKHRVQQIIRQAVARITAYTSDKRASDLDEAEITVNRAIVAFSTEAVSLIQQEMPHLLADDVLPVINAACDEMLADAYRKEGCLH